MSEKIMAKVMNFRTANIIFAIFFISLSNLVTQNNSLAQEKDSNSSSKPYLAENKEVITKKQVINNGFADIVEELMPAVVNISTTQKIKSAKIANNAILDSLSSDSDLDNLKSLLKKQNSKKNDKILSLGSGFVISEDGYIVTGYHVIEDSDEIIVALNDASKFKANIVGFDKKTDLALLKIEVKNKLKCVKFGDSNKIRIGDWAIVIGNPFGFGGSVSIGIISAIGRNINANQYYDLIQTDAAINKGNSGGPLLNINGEVVGISTAIFSTSGGNMGIGFAIPSSSATLIIEQLKKGGQVTRGWLGVLAQDLSKEISQSVGIKTPKGVLVIEVTKESPAEKAGILPTDIITKFDGQEIHNIKDLPRIVAKTPIDKKVQITIVRQGKTKVLTTKIEKLIESSGKAIGDGLNKEKIYKPSEYVLGIGLLNIDEKVRKENKIDIGISGVLITDIETDSLASKFSFIETGDLILSINQKPIKSISDLKNVIEQAKKAHKDNVLLFIMRAGLKFAISFPIK